MSVPNRGQLVAAAWEDYVDQNPADQIFNYFWLLENLRVGNTFKKGAGDPITGTIEYAPNTTVQSISEMESLDVVRIDVFDRYEYPWKFKAGLLVMSDFERMVTEGSAGKFDLEAGKMDNLKNSMMQQLNGDLYSDGTADGGKQIGGLQLLVADSPTTGTPGNINRAIYTFWRNQQASGAKSSTAFDNLKSTMRSLYNLCSSGVGMQNPEFASTDLTDFQGYESLSTTIERLARSSVTDKLISGYKGDHIMFKDIPVAYDNQAPAGKMYILNRRNLFIRWLCWMKAFPPGTPVNQFINVVKILTIANLCTDNPRRLGVATAIT